MRRSLANSILTAFEARRDKLPDSGFAEQPVTLHVTFSLGDLRDLRLTIAEIDRMTPHANRA